MLRVELLQQAVSEGSRGHEGGGGGRTGSVLRCEMVMVVMSCSTAALYNCSSASIETAEVHSCGT